MPQHDLRIHPSLLSCDFAHIADELARVEEAGADAHHVDVMDGHFVPNLTLGPPVVERIAACARRPLDVHLMITDPLGYARAFLDAGADGLTLHAELFPEPEELRKALTRLRELGTGTVGVAVNPATPVEDVLGVLDALDMVLVMSVVPGFGGQSFREEVLPKVRRLREEGFRGRIQMDGGIGPDTAAACVAAGADILVAGSAIYATPDPAGSLATLRERASGARGGGTP